MEGEMKNLIQVYISIFASLCYCYFIVKRIPKGFIRLFFLLPIFYYFTILPYAFPINIRSLFTFLFTWLGNFKLLLFSFGQGPLSSDQAKSSLKYFISIACFPITIINKKVPSDYQNNKSYLNLSFVIIFSLYVLANYVYGKTNYQSRDPRNLIVLLCVYVNLEVLLAMFSTLARAILDVELEPQFDKPYLSTSLQDFWGRRWNLTITNILRHTIYDPARRIFTFTFGRRCATFPSVLITFVVSGLMHELMFFHVSNKKPTWEVTWCFFVHGFCAATEIEVKKAVAGRLKLHRFITIPLTVGYVCITSMWFFLPPFVESGTAQGYKDVGVAIDEFLVKKLFYS